MTTYRVTCRCGYSRPFDTFRDADANAVWHEEMRKWPRPYQHETVVSKREDR